MRRRRGGTTDMMTPLGAAGETFVHFCARPRRWAVWSLNAQALGYILSVIVAAPLVVLAEFGWRNDLGTAPLLRFAVLVLAAVTYAEAFDRIERIRRFLGDDRVRSNHLSVWTTAGVLALPPTLATVL